MDPYTGRVLAMVGGFSFAESEFNRATQAWRQPGSSFKPFVYAAALDNGYTPSSVILDAPIEIDVRPTTSGGRQNYGGKFYGPSTLRTGIEQSRNVMTVRLAQDMGMPLVAEYAEALRHLRQPGARTCRWRSAPARRRCCGMVTAYAMIANGGRKIDADADRPHPGPLRPRRSTSTTSGTAKPATRRPGAARPSRTLVDNREQVLDPMTAYQITSMMEGVVQRGTATTVAAGRASRSPARPARPTTRRTPGSSASRPTSWSASSSATTSRGRWARGRPAACSRRRSSPSS